MSGARRLRRTVGTGAVLLGLAMAWTLARDAEADAGLLYLDAGRVMAARPDWAASRSLLAEERLVSGDNAGAAAAARAALASDPLDVRALRTLGFADERLGRPAEASRLLAFAGQRSWRDTATQLWLLRQAATVGDGEAAIQHGDALARRLQLLEIVFPAFSSFAADPDARAELISRLSLDPYWRALYIRSTSTMPAADAAGVTALLLDMARAGDPPAESDAAGFIDRLAGEGQYAVAHALWRAIYAPDDGSAVHDGGFARFDAADAAMDQPAFEWRLNRRSVAQVEAVAPPIDPTGRALQIHVAGIATAPVADQTVILAPGPQRVSARVFADPVDQAARVRITILCLPALGMIGQGGAAIAGSPAAGGWRVIDFPVTVPAVGCPAQVIRLSLTGAGTSAPADIFLDDVDVR